MTIRSLGINRHGFPGARTRLGGNIHGPQHRGSEHESLVVDHVLAEASASTPSESVHRVPVAEVRVLCQWLLVRRPAWLNPAVGAEVLRIGVFRRHTVDSPIQLSQVSMTIIIVKFHGAFAGIESYHSQARMIVFFLIFTPRNSSSRSAWCGTP